MYKFNFSVRAYVVCMTRGYDITNVHGCVAAANDLINCPFRGVGKRTITELYRAGGLGIYQIAKLIEKNPAEVRKMCEHFDKTLHSPIYT